MHLKCVNLYPYDQCWETHASVYIQSVNSIVICIGNAFINMCMNSVVK